MNTQVFTPFVILTNNPNIGDRFEDSRKKTNSFTEFLSVVQDAFEEEEYITLTSENTEILSFEFQIEGNQAKSPPPNIVIEFIDKFGNFDLEVVKKASKLKVGSNGEVDTPKTMFYCAFGLGDNLDYWSGFNSMTLISAATFQKFNQPKSIQLNFGVSLGFHESFKSVLSKVTNDSILASLSFNASPITAKLYGSFYEKTKLAKEPSPLNGEEEPEPGVNFQENSDLICDYLLGFNQTDGLIKQVINKFLRSVFSQQLNVFLATDDIRKFILKGKASKLNRLDRQQGKGRSGNYKPPTEAYIEVEQELVTNLDAYLDLQVTNKQEGNTSGEDRVHYLTFSVVNSSQDPLNLEQKREKLEEKLKNLSEGLSQQTGIGDDKIILVREADKNIVKNFIKLLTENAKKQLNLNPDLPILFFGEEKLIRSMLYGDEFSIDDKDVTQNKYPLNKKTFKYLNIDWQETNLYGSKPTEEDTKSLEKFLKQAAGKFYNPEVNYKNFPIFRYNVANSNVLDLSTEENNLYYSLLYTGLTEYPKIYDQYRVNQEEIKVRDAGVITKISVTLAEKISQYINRKAQKDAERNVLTPEEALNLIKLSNKIKLDHELVIQLSKFIKEQELYLEPSITQEDLKNIPFLSQYSTYSDTGLVLLVNTISNFLKDEESSDRTSTVGINKALGDIEAQQKFIDSGISLEPTKLILDPLITYYDLYNFIDEIPIEVEITTLPFFRLSNFYWLGYPCLLFAERTKLIGSTSKDPVDSYISGNYIITSIKHKITSNDCESVIKLTKYSNTIRSKGSAQVNA